MLLRRSSAPELLSKKNYEIISMEENDNNDKKNDGPNVELPNVELPVEDDLKKLKGREAWGKESKWTHSVLLTLYMHPGEFTKSTEWREVWAEETPGAPNDPKSGSFWAQSRFLTENGAVITNKDGYLSLNDDHPYVQKFKTELIKTEPVQKKPETPEPVQEKHETPEPVQEKHETPEPVQEKHETPEPVPEKHETPEPVQVVAEKELDIEKLYEETLLPVDILEDMIEYLDEGRAIVIYGRPSTWKSNVAMALARYRTCSSTKEDVRRRIKKVQFHQNYSYDDLIEGMLPRTIMTSPGIYEVTWEFVPGKLIKLCDEIKDKNDERFAFVGNELNRANMTSIMGEFSELLGDREEDNQVSLSRTDRLLYIPDKVDLIFTMNEFDISTVDMDEFWIRRFVWFNLPPDANILKRWLEKNPHKNPDGIDIVGIFTRLNEKIKIDLGEDYQIGHGYFTTKKGRLDKDKLRRLFKYEILFLIKRNALLLGKNINLKEYELESLMNL